MSYQVTTRVFEGPLDLLLQLITSHQLEITEVSLTEIVSEYLGYLDAMRELDLDVTSEFLLIAATLVQLKARHLLPGDRDIDLDEELALAEERDRLLSRLLACLTFKDVAAVFGHRMESNLRYVPRSAGLDPGIEAPLPDVRLTVTAAEFGLLAERVFSAPPEDPDLDHLELDLPSVDSAIADIRSRVGAGVETHFAQLVDHCDRPIEVVAYFLAVLELVRWGVVRIDQAETDGPIAVAGQEAPDGAELQSEWSV